MMPTPMELNLFVFWLVLFCVCGLFVVFVVPYLIVRMNRKNEKSQPLGFALQNPARRDEHVK